MQIRLAFAGTECAVLPIRELAAYPRCSVCEQLNAGERTSARRFLPTPSASRQIRLEQGRQPLRRANRQLPRLGTGSLEISSGCGRRLVRGQRISLTVSLVCAPSLCACVVVLTAEREPINPPSVEHNIRNHPTLACGPCARPQYVCSGTSCSSPSMSAPAKPWEVDAQEPECTEPAHSRRSLCAQHGRA